MKQVIATYIRSMLRTSIVQLLQCYAKCRTPQSSGGKLGYSSCSVMPSVEHPKVREVNMATALAVLCQV